MSITYLNIPTTCPCCGHPTVVKTDPRSGVNTLWCDNPDCSAKGLAKWKHFVKRDAMNIVGISEAILSDMLDLGIINEKRSSIYTAGPSEICRLCTELEGYGEKKVYNILDAIEASRDVALENAIFAFGIPSIGIQTAKLLVKITDGDLDNLSSPSIIQKIYNTSGLGAAVATAWTEFMQSDDAEDFFYLCDEIFRLKKQETITGELNGLTFCCTGAVEIYKNRKELQADIEARGGKFTSSVTGNTSYLITNDTTSGSAKNKAAQKLGIPILTEQQFIDQFINK